VAETAELLGVEASIGTSKLEIGHATKDFIAGRLGVNSSSQLAGPQPKTWHGRCVALFRPNLGLT